MELAWGDQKASIFMGYSRFAKFKGAKFEKPGVPDAEPGLSFIPIEAELDSLISGIGPKLGTLLLFLKNDRLHFWRI